MASPDQFPIENGLAAQALQTDRVAALANETTSDGNTLVYRSADGKWHPEAAASSGVSAVTAASPLSSSGGATPQISLTGVVDVAHGGTGSALGDASNLINLPAGQLVGNAPLASIATALAAGGGAVKGTILTATTRVEAPTVGTSSATQHALPAGTADILTADSTATLTNKSITVGQLTGTLLVSQGGTGSSTALANNRSIVSSGGALVEGNAPIDTQDFTSTGTWTDPGFGDFVRVILIAGGGGGGSGGSNTSTSCSGGGAGQGGGVVDYTFPRSAVTSPLTVTVGTGGNGGSQTSAGAGNGNAGAAGGNTSFGSLIVAIGGQAGSAGGATTASTAANLAGQGQWIGGVGFGCQNASATTTPGQNLGFSPGGGGHGGQQFGGVGQNGAAGGGVWLFGVSGGAGGTKDITAPTAGTAGANQSLPRSGPGGGGGGSAYNSGGVGAAGGAGGKYGGGGGGGGSCFGGIAGAGGAGGAGCARIITF